MRKPKTASIYIRVSEHDHSEFTKAAHRDDQSLSDWLRRLGRQRIEAMAFEAHFSRLPKPPKGMTVEELIDSPPRPSKATKRTRGVHS